MRFRYSAGAAIVAAAFTLHSTPLFAQSSAEDELRQEVKLLRERLEQLEKKLEQSAAPAPAKEAVAQPAPQDRALQQRVDELDSQVRVLNRKQEIEQEQAAEDRKVRPSIGATERGLEIKSADGQNSIRLRGVVQTDGRFFLSDSPGTDTFLLRKVRPTVEGTVGGIYDYRIMPDFGGGKAVVQEAYARARFAPYAQLYVGKFKSPVGLERLQLDADTRLVERAFPTDIAPNRDIGVDLHGDLLKETLEYDIGYFNGALDGRSSEDFTNEQDNNNDKDLVARIFTRPFRNTPSIFQDLGFGIAASYSDASGSSPAAGTTATAQQTNLFTYPTPAQQTFFSYRTTGPATYAAGEHLRWSPQAYWYYRSVGLMAEYIVSDQEVARNAPPGAARTARLKNSAWQVQLTYLLTGEDESFGGVRPKRPFAPGSGGWGAWELVGRYSGLNVDSDAFTGGALSFADPTVSARSAKEWSAGLNWYLNWNVKLQLDYSRTKFQGGGGGTLAAPLDRADEQLVFGRVQLAF